MNNKIVLVKGAYGDGNIGDDLLLEMVIELLLIKGFQYINIIVTGKQSTYMDRMFPKIKVVSLARSRFMNSDYLILGGGTQFFSFSEKKVQVNKFNLYSKILYNDPRIFLDILKSITSSKEDAMRIALGIGVGPFNNETAEDEVKIKLKSFDQVLCRDKKSKFYCNKWGVNSELTADICISDLFRRKYNKTHQLKQDGQKVIGFVLRDWTQNENGDIINNFILNSLMDYNDYEIKVFIFSKIKDSKLINLVEESNLVDKSNFHVWDPDNDSVDNYLDEFNQCDVIITSRYHAAIFSLNYSIPAICLAIDPKLMHIVDEVEGFLYCKIEELQTLKDDVQQIFNSYDELQKNIQLSYKKLNKRANKMLHVLSDL